jgi:DNA-binding NarL/FixJ family response regulator
MTRTLIAEGDAHTRAVLTWLLEHDGRFEVVATPDCGESALAWDGPLDAALVDIALPGLDALQTVRALRNRYPRIAIVVVAGVDVPYLRAAAAEAGADGYVNRTADAPHLLDLLASLYPVEDG